MKATFFVLPALAALASATDTNSQAKRQISVESIDLASLAPQLQGQLQDLGINPESVEPVQGQSDCAQCVDSCSQDGDAFNFACKVVKCGIQCLIA